MLAGQMLSQRLILSRLVLIPKPVDTPLAPPVHTSTTPASVIFRPLGLPEIFYRLVGRAAVRIEGPGKPCLHGMETVLLIRNRAKIPFRVSPIASPPPVLGVQHPCCGVVLVV